MELGPKNQTMYGFRNPNSIMALQLHPLGCTYIYIYIYLERHVAQNNRPLYPKVAHTGAKVAHNYRLLAFQVYNNGPYNAYTLYIGILGHYFGHFWRSSIYIYTYIDSVPDLAKRSSNCPEHEGAGRPHHRMGL